MTVKADQARIDSMCREAEQTWAPALSKLMQVGLSGFDLLQRDQQILQSKWKLQYLLVNENTCK